MIEISGKIASCAIDWKRNSSEKESRKLAFAIDFSSFAEVDTLNLAAAQAVIKIQTACRSAQQVPTDGFIVKHGINRESLESCGFIFNNSNKASAKLASIRELLIKNGQRPEDYGL